MAISYRALAHVAIRAKRYDVMYDFYVNKLGGREVFHLNHDCRPESEGNEGIWLTYIGFGKGQYIELFNEGYKGENAFGTTSFAAVCLAAGNMAQAMKTLEAQGIPIYDRPNGRRLQAPFSQYGPDECGTLSAYVSDPEGNWIEIQQFRPASLQIVCD